MKPFDAFAYETKPQGSRWLLIVGVDVTVFPFVGGGQCAQMLRWSETLRARD
jgi:hypothetical protein